MDHEHDHAAHDSGAQSTLDRIEAGSHHLLTITRRRIADVLDALDEGDFRAAVQSMATAQQAMTPLANAQSYIAIAGNAELIETQELKIGMVIVDVGTVSTVEVEQCDALHCDGHVKVKIGEHEMSFGAKQQVYVEHDAPDDAEAEAA